MTVTNKILLTYAVALITLCVIMFFTWSWIYLAIVLVLGLFFHPDRLARIYSNND
jgi:fucose permease